MIAIIAASLVLVIVVVYGQMRDPEPQAPDDQQEDTDEDNEQEDYTEFTGRVMLNGEDLELNNTPLVAKGLVHLPFLELADEVQMEINRDEDNKILFIGGEGNADREADENWKIYTGGTDITPANIIEEGDEFYIEAREAAALVELNIYENLFANSVQLTDDSVASRDGDYVVVRQRDERGWAPELHMTVSDGNISSVDYREMNAEGVNKQEDQEYLENWSAANDIDPAALILQMENQLVETQSISEVDIVTGATGSWKNFVQLAANALGKAKTGVLAEQFPDGDYVAVGDPSDQGWSAVLEFTVTDGAITELVYDENDAEGNSKRDNEEYLENWRNAYAEIDPVAILEEREDNILKTQDPNLIDATTGATGWGVNLKQYTTGALDQAARVALPDGYDTIYVFFGAMSERGERPQLMLAAAAEEIVFVDFSEYGNGNPKKFNDTYLAAWKDQYPDADPLKAVTDMQDIFLTSKNPDDLDVVSGATSWRNSFKELAARALDYIDGE